MSVQQISVFLENRGGQLAQVTRVLADNQIDMRALSIAETADYGVLRLIVDDVDKATVILLENGYVISVTQVTVIPVADQAGGLAPLLEMLSEASIDIEYMYSLFTHKEGTAYMVFRVSDEARLRALLAEKDIALAGPEDLGIE